MYIHNFAIRVSIHAPVKGATLHTTKLCDVREDVSIHAPVKGATRSNGSERLRATTTFQSTLP